MGLAVVLLGGTSLDYGMPSVLVVLLAIPIVVTGLTIALPLVGILEWRDRGWSTRGRVLYSSFALAALAFIPYLHYWNLLGFRLG